LFTGYAYLPGYALEKRAVSQQIIRLGPYPLVRYPGKTFGYVGQSGSIGKNFRYHLASCDMVGSNGKDYYDGEKMISMASPTRKDMGLKSHLDQTQPIFYIYIIIVTN